MQALRTDLITAANHQGLAVAAAGTAPLSSAADLELTALGRYSRMQQDYRLLVDQHLVCGLQVHVDVEDPDLAVRLIPWVESALPTLLALSASSPFFEGQDTGYASVRTVIWQRWPTAGRTPRLETYAEYRELIQSLIDASVISDDKMAYFDVRPSPHLPTLELRVCDSCPLVDDAILIAGLFRAAVERAIDAESTGGTESEPLGAAVPGRHVAGRPQRPVGHADRRWAGTGRPCPPPRWSGHLVDDLRPQLEDSGDWEVISELTAAAMARGTSSERQRARYAERGRVDDVVRSVDPRDRGSGRPSPFEDPVVGELPGAGRRRGGAPDRDPLFDVRAHLRGPGAIRPGRDARSAPRVRPGSGAHVRGRRGAAPLPGRSGPSGHTGPRMGRPGGGAHPAGPGHRGLPAGRLRAGRDRPGRRDGPRRHHQL